MNIIKMWILDNVRNAISSKGRQLKQTYNNIVNSPEMQYVKMAAPRSRIINARNQLWWAWQDYINATYPETWRWADNTSPYYETYWIRPRYSEEATQAAENYNKIYDEFAPALWIEAETWWPYSRNYWVKSNIPYNLKNERNSLVRVSAPSGTSQNEIIDSRQNIAPAAAWQTPWMTYSPTPLFQKWEIKQWADVLREMQKQVDLYREEERKLQEDREKYNAELIAMVEKNWKNEAWAKKKDQYEYELVQRRNALMDKALDLYNLKEQYNKTLADMTKAPDLINYKQ